MVLAKLPDMITLFWKTEIQFRQCLMLFRRLLLWKRKKPTALLKVHLSLGKKSILFVIDSSLLFLFIINHSPKNHFHADLWQRVHTHTLKSKCEIRQDKNTLLLKTCGKCDSSCYRLTSGVSSLKIFNYFDFLFVTTLWRWYWMNAVDNRTAFIEMAAFHKLAKYLFALVAPV